MDGAFAFVRLRLCVFRLRVCVFARERERNSTKRCFLRKFLSSLFPFRQRATTLTEYRHFLHQTFKMR